MRTVHKSPLDIKIKTPTDPILKHDLFLELVYFEIKEEIWLSVEKQRSLLAQLLGQKEEEKLE